MRTKITGHAARVLREQLHSQIPHVVEAERTELEVAGAFVMHAFVQGWTPDIAQSMRSKAACMANHTAAVALLTTAQLTHPATSHARGHKHPHGKRRRYPLALYA